MNRRNLLIVLVSTLTIFTGSLLVIGWALAAQRREQREMLRINATVVADNATVRANLNPSPTASLYPTVTPFSTVTHTPTLTIPPSPTLTNQPPTATATTVMHTATATSTPCACYDDLYNCATDFLSQRTAQRCYTHCLEQGAGDIHQLDHDGDGDACESLP
jgi:hypothetical protein